MVQNDSPARGGSDEPLEPPLDPPLGKASVAAKKALKAAGGVEIVSVVRIRSPKK